MPGILRVCLWSGPRNVSTALMYSFAQRSDSIVVDEPLYAHYLRVTGAKHPGRDEVLAAQDSDGARVVRDIILGSAERDVLFIKGMAHHLIGLDLGFLAETENVLLTRDPREMLPSLVNQIPEPSLTDTGLPQQVELLHAMHDAGRPVVVIDARRLLLDPEAQLRSLCSHLGIRFEEGMLSWPSGGRTEDGVWAHYWYQNVHASTGFAPYVPKSNVFPDSLRPLLRECLPLYEELAESAIRTNE